MVQVVASYIKEILRNPRYVTTRHTVPTNTCTKMWRLWEGEVHSLMCVPLPRHFSNVVLGKDGKEMRQRRGWRKEEVGRGMMGRTGDNAWIQPIVS